MKLPSENSKPHTVSATKDITTSLVCDVLQQPAYSLHITPSYYYLFQHSLRTSGSMVGSCLETQNFSIVHDRIHRLSGRWFKSYKKHGRMCLLSNLLYIFLNEL